MFPEQPNRKQPDIKKSEEEQPAKPESYYKSLAALFSHIIGKQDRAKDTCYSDVLWQARIALEEQLQKRKNQHVLVQAFVKAGRNEISEVGEPIKNKDAIWVALAFEQKVINSISADHLIATIKLLDPSFEPERDSDKKALISKFQQLQEQERLKIIAEILKIKYGAFAENLPLLEDKGNIVYYFMLQPLMMGNTKAINEKKFIIDHIVEKLKTSKKINLDDFSNKEKYLLHLLVHLIPRDSRSKYLRNLDRKIKTPKTEKYYRSAVEYLDEDLLSVAKKLGLATDELKAIDLHKLPLTELYSLVIRNIHDDLDKQDRKARCHKEPSEIGQEDALRYLLGVTDIGIIRKLLSPTASANAAFGGNRSYIGVLGAAAQKIIKPQEESLATEILVLLKAITSDESISEVPKELKDSETQSLKEEEQKKDSERATQEEALAVKINKLKRDRVSKAYDQLVIHLAFDIYSHLSIMVGARIEIMKYLVKLEVGDETTTPTSSPDCSTPRNAFFSPRTSSSEYAKDKKSKVKTKDSSQVPSKDEEKFYESLLLMSRAVAETPKGEYLSPRGGKYQAIFNNFIEGLKMSEQTSLDALVVGHVCNYIRSLQEVIQLFKQLSLLLHPPVKVTEAKLLALQAKSPAMLTLSFILAKISLTNHHSAILGVINEVLPKQEGASQLDFLKLTRT